MFSTRSARSFFQELQWIQKMSQTQILPSCRRVRTWPQDMAIGHGSGHLLLYFAASYLYLINTGTLALYMSLGEALLQPPMKVKESSNLCPQIFWAHNLGLAKRMCPHRTSILEQVMKDEGWRRDCIGSWNYQQQGMVTIKVVASLQIPSDQPTGQMTCLFFGFSTILSLHHIIQ